MSRPLFTIQGGNFSFPCLNYQMPDVNSILNSVGITNRIGGCCGMSIPAPIMYGTAVNVPGMLGIPQIFSDMPNYANGTYNPLGSAMFVPWMGQFDPFSTPYMQNMINPGWNSFMPNMFNPMLSGGMNNPFQAQNNSMSDMLMAVGLVTGLTKILDRLENIDDADIDEEEPAHKGRKEGAGESGSVEESSGSSSDSKVKESKELQKLRNLLKIKDSGFAAQELIDKFKELNDSEFKTLMAEVYEKGKNSTISEFLNDKDKTKEVELYIANRLIADRQKHLSDIGLDTSKLLESTDKSIEKLSAKDEVFQTLLDDDNIVFNADRFVSSSYGGGKGVVDIVGGKYLKNLILLLSKAKYSTSDNYQGRLPQKKIDVDS